MSTFLAKYDAACKALAAAVKVDEVAKIRDYAKATEMAARIAKNRMLEVQAAGLRFRAERRLGELLRSQVMDKGGRPAKKTPSREEGVLKPAKLKAMGIDYKLSMRVQKLAALPADRFAVMVKEHARLMLDGQKVPSDLMKIDAEERGREARRDLAQAMSDETARTPAGRKFAAMYLDPAWERKAGIGNRAYENHYPTMTWGEIVKFAETIKALLLPDAWIFMWIPRAHLLALVDFETDGIDAKGNKVRVTVKMPLAWAVGKAIGADSYSTCYVWTKTDDEHPNDRGTGLIVWDQDELLLQFKRGAGLPKPRTSEKFGSNHRERSKPLGHSRKPQHYRKMIAAMTGGLPVVELFARHDEKFPLPKGWVAWGNQANGDAEKSRPLDRADARKRKARRPAQPKRRGHRSRQRRGAARKG